MKLEVGMYVRYQYENVIYIGKINFISETMGFEEKLMFSVDNCIEEIYKENVIKACYNIIDILEVGDYVNGKEVTDKFDYLLSFGNNDYYLNKEDIKSIVTKEQFEQISYKVGD